MKRQRNASFSSKVATNDVFECLQHIRGRLLGEGDEATTKREHCSQSSILRSQIGKLQF